MQPIDPVRPPNPVPATHRIERERRDREQQSQRDDESANNQDDDDETEHRIDEYV
ncbi:MAG: hypothetical protein KJO55_07940 [Gammaproteobacteria bacterium]|nr:hypothetical protein [Gammaproteobacteria bacterium]NND61476.1 hypothetical protein [Gammaproteobacteria bacterium]